MINPDHEAQVQQPPRARVSALAKFWTTIKSVLSGMTGCEKSGAKLTCEHFSPIILWTCECRPQHTTHFPHENVIAHCNRSFRSAAETDAILIENMWKVVKPEDYLWVVRDFAFGPKAKEVACLEGVLGQLPDARKRLVTRNHDLGLTLGLPWDSVRHLLEVHDGPTNQAHTLCHYPMIT